MRVHKENNQWAVCLESLRLPAGYDLCEQAISIPILRLLTVFKNTVLIDDQLQMHE